MNKIKRPVVGRVFFATLLTACSGWAAQGHAPQARQGRGHRRADMVIVNARVWTGTEREAQSVAIVGERIAYVGSDSAAQAWIGDRTRVIDAEGRRVIPGITDSHCHIVSGGFHLARLNLRDVASRDAFVATVAQAVAGTAGDTETPGAGKHGTGGWLTGGRWSVESWDDPTPPRKEWIDPVTPDTPVFLSRMDGHQGLANSVALRVAGIDARGPADPPGGVIERDRGTGAPTGILKDAAMDLVTRHIPPPTDEQRYDALLRAMRHANTLGITSMHDMSGREDLKVMFRARRERTLTVRIHKYLAVSDWPASIEEVRGFDVHDPWLRVAGFKGYMDGSMGSRTAYMYRPYADAAPDADYPGGILAAMAVPPKHLRYMIERADAAGLQCVVHAIGDEANHILLDAYASVARKNGPRDARHRIEHAQHLLPEDIPRFASLGVVASMQPYHKADDGRYGETALGAARLKGSYAFRSLMQSGATVAFGSDWPVVTCDPFLGMAAAVTSRTLDGKVWIPEESITIEQALSAYTVNAAFACHAEGEVGTLEAGKLADMVILSQDILRVAGERIGQTRAVVTIVGGRVVFDAER